jgi:hypothetical protein
VKRTWSGRACTRNAHFRRSVTFGAEAERVRGGTPPSRHTVTWAWWRRGFQARRAAACKMHLTCRCASPLPCLCRPSPGGAGVRCARRFAAPQISGRLPLVPGERRPNRAETAAAAAPCRRSYCTCGCRSMPTPTPFSSSLPTSRSCQRRPRSRAVRPGRRLYSLVLACSATRLRGAPRSTRATAHASLSRTLLLHGPVRACLSLPLAGRAGVPAVPNSSQPRIRTHRRRRRHRVRPASEKGAGRGLRFLQSLPRGFAEAASFPIACFRFQRFLICFFILFYRDASVSFVVRARQSPPARGEESGRRAPPPLHHSPAAAGSATRGGQVRATADRTWSPAIFRAGKEDKKCRRRCRCPARHHRSGSGTGGSEVHTPAARSAVSLGE